MASPTQRVERAGGESPRRVVVVTVLVTFWATLLLALGVPGAGPILLAALGGGAMVAVRRLLAGRRTVPRVRVRPALERLQPLAQRLRLPRGLPRPKLPALPAVRLPAAVGTVGLRRTRLPEPPAPFGGGRAGEAWRFCRLGAQLRRQGRLAAAVESFETAVWIFRDLDEPHGLALALNGLGLALVRQRRLDAAVARYQEAAEILGRVDDRHAHGQVLANLGTALRSQGRSAEAQASWDDALARLEPGSAEHVRIRELRAVG
jgi:tetratricopeptide (TPR) repeat protein